MQPITKRTVGRLLTIGGGLWLFGAWASRSQRYWVALTALTAVIAGAVMTAQGTIEETNPQ